MSTIFPPFSAVLFDLDGTLVDTAPDLAFALKSLLQEHGKSSLDYHLVRPVASHGSAGLLKLAFGIESDHTDYDSLQQRFLHFYQHNLTRETRLFNGMETVLDTLEKKNIPWGIITNKPAFLTDPLLEQLQLTQRAACIVSADTTAHSKPHPEPMLYACKKLQLEPDKCIYIGDALRDIEAGNIVDMYTIIALYGYLSHEDKPETWQANTSITHPLELLKWL